jgi:Mg2+ and Co2+ transporter CorA
MQDVVCFHGTYRYATRESLEQAICSARAVLAEEEANEAETAWMRCFVTRGTVLTVNLTSHVDRFSAAAVFDMLAETAIEGAVEARLGDAQIDLFPSGRRD